MVIEERLDKIEKDIEFIKGKITNIEEMIRASIVSQLIKNGTIKIPTNKLNVGINESSFKITIKTQEELDLEAEAQ